MKPFDRLRWIMAIRATAPIKAVLICLSIHADRQERAWPSQALIAVETGLSVPTVKRALAEIRKARSQDDQPIVSVATRHNRSTIYTLQFDGIMVIPRWYQGDPRNSTRTVRKRKPPTHIAGQPVCNACKSKPSASGPGGLCLGCIRERKRQDLVGRIIDAR